MKFNASSMKDKEVVNVTDGRKLGCISDVEFDSVDGKISAFIIPGEKGFFGIGASQNVIGWDRVVRIGEDVVLVNISDNMLPPPDKKGSEKGKM